MILPAVGKFSVSIININNYPIRNFSSNKIFIFMQVQWKSFSRYHTLLQKFASNTFNLAIVHKGSVEKLFSSFLIFLYCRKSLSSHFFNAKLQYCLRKKNETWKIICFIEKVNFLLNANFHQNFFFSSWKGGRKKKFEAENICENFFF